MDAWKTIVFFFWGMAYFQVRAVSFRVLFLLLGCIYKWSKQGVVILDFDLQIRKFLQFFLPWPFFELLVDQK